MADPRAARLKAQADLLIAQAQESAAKLKGGASVMEADTAALEKRRAEAEAQAAASEAGGEQPDITQFFQATPVNVKDPVGSLQRLGIQPPPGALGAAGPSGAVGGQIANQQVAQARQAAGTAPTAQPSAGPTGQPSISVQGQQIQGPPSYEVSRENIQQREVMPGVFLPMRSTSVETIPNVIRAGDILQAKVRQEEAAKDRALVYGNMILDHSLRSTQARATVAAELRRGTNMPPEVSLLAADATLTGNEELFRKLTAGYDTTGAAGIASQRAMAAYYGRMLQNTAGMLNINDVSMYSPLPFFGEPLSAKAPTASDQLNSEARVRDDLRGIFGQGPPSGILGRTEISASEQAARISSAAREARRSTGQVLIFPTVNDEPSIAFTDMREIVALRALAEGAGSAKDNETAQRVLEDMGLGRMREGKWDTTQVPDAFRPYADELDRAYRMHKQLEGFIPKVTVYMAPTVTEKYLDNPRYSK